MNIFIDMDDVIYNLAEEVRKNVNEDFHENYEENYNQTYWYKDYLCADIEYFKKLLHKKGLFIDGKPINGAIDYINMLFEEGNTIYIVTDPQHSETCVYEKILWKKKMIDFIPSKNIIFASQKHLLANKNNILIDDNLDNLNAWEEHGGISIAFGNYGWNKDFEGLHADNWKATYNLIKALKIDAIK